MKVKIITENFNENLEKSLNNWLEENPGIKVISITPYFVTMIERFHHDSSIANQWHEYTVTVLYE